MYLAYNKIVSLVIWRLNRREETAGGGAGKDGKQAGCPLVVTCVQRVAQVRTLPVQASMSIVSIPYFPILDGKETKGAVTSLLQPLAADQ